jgi:hypothetical protein
MKAQITGNDLRGRRAGRLVGALGLLLALVLLAGGLLPAYATDLEPPPQLPHYFAGTVSVISPPGPVPEGTVVEALVDGVKKAETTVNEESGYELLVPGEFGDEGKIISFKVAGVQASPGASTGLNDLLGYLGCFIATAAYGTPTAEQIDVLREFRDVVLLKSTVGSQFVALYYQLSPPIADFIARSDLLRTLVRELLVDPIVWIVEATGDIWRN